jgi:hypothetical protein
MGWNCTVTGAIAGGGASPSALISTSVSSSDVQANAGTTSITAAKRISQVLLTIVSSS